MIARGSNLAHVVVAANSQKMGSVPTRAALEFVAIHSSLYAPGHFVSATQPADVSDELNNQRWDVSFSKAVISITRR